MTTLLDVIRYTRGISPRELTIMGLDSRVEIGPQTDAEQAKVTVNRVLIATYPSARVVAKASQDKSNLLITGLPMFPYAVDRLTGIDLIRTRLLSKNYICSCYVGSSYIAARNGLVDALVEMLEMNPTRNFEIAGDYSDAVPFGRICEPASTYNHSGFANSVAQKMGLDHVVFTGDLDAEVLQVLVTVGPYMDIPEIVEATRRDVTTLVTGELAPEVRLFVNEEGINTLELGAFVTESPGMKRLRHQFSLEYPDLKVDFSDSPPYYKSLKPYEVKT